MNKNNLNFIFFGTPEVASLTLETLKESEFLPSIIVTSPDARSGRGLHMEPSPVAIFAEKNNIPCLKPNKLDKEFLLKLSAFSFQLSIVVAYGKIMPESLINKPKLGSINIHYSLLPKYRGASPVESVILNGEKITGVTIQQMQFAMDSGPILAKEEVEIKEDEKAGELRTRLIKTGGELLVKTIPKIINQEIKPIHQNEQEVTFCKKIKKEDGLINLESDGVKNYNKFRAYANWPRTFFFKQHLPAGRQERIIITDARLENSKFVIKKVLPEGRKEITWEEFQKIN